MRIVLTGGGTGGHVIPNLAVIEELRKHKKIEILYIGSRDGIEKKIVEKAGINFKGVHCGKFRRYFSFKNFIDFFKIPVGIFQAGRILDEFKPEKVFSKGGFVGFPVVFAASRRKIPIVVHESDVVPGLANQISFKYADKICISFEETKKYLKRCEEKIIFTGNPIRESILDGNENEGFRITGFDKHRPIILVIGGSQGAAQINELIRVSLDELLKRFQIVHIRGKGKLDISIHKKGYVQFEYLDEELKHIYAVCDMIISRGGANSLAEIALLKKKALIIPLGGAATRGDQIENTRILSSKFGWGVLAGEITREDFIKAIEMSFRNSFDGNVKFENGTKRIVDLLLKR